MIRSVFIILIAQLFFITAKAQVLNNVSHDKTNMYYHGLDSVVKILSLDAPLKRILLRTETSLITPECH
jgi:hypothetical protein